MPHLITANNLSSGAPCLPTPHPKTSVNEKAIAGVRDCGSVGLLNSQLTSIPYDPQCGGAGRVFASITFVRSGPHLNKSRAS